MFSLRSLMTFFTNNNKYTNKPRIEIWMSEFLLEHRIKFYSFHYLKQSNRHVLCLHKLSHVSVLRLFLCYFSITELVEEIVLYSRFVSYNVWYVVRGSPLRGWFYRCTIKTLLKSLLFSRKQYTFSIIRQKISFLLRHRPSWIQNGSFITLALSSENGVNMTNSKVERKTLSFHRFTTKK